MYIPEITCSNTLCNQKFTPKDARQNYCNRKCQQDWNNHKAKRKRDTLKPVTTALQRNRGILRKIQGSLGESTVSAEYLRGAGFNFKVQTHNRMEEEQLYHCVYDYGIQKVGNEKYKIKNYGK
ncbi:MAG: hypothetical protein K8S00_00030 [Bacteroidales bacterium]|nr:hypothetical protein [Bacteroidales bacterium]